VHERHSLSDFKAEGYIAIVLVVIIAIHLIGTRANRAKAKAWAKAHAGILQREFALVGFGGRKTPSAADAEGAGLARTLATGELESPEKVLKESGLNAFVAYASGRQNVAFVDVEITLLKRYNPLIVFAEYAMSFFFDSMPAPVEKMNAVLYPFDGKEALTVPGLIPGTQELRGPKSGYDNFVWAVVNKDSMKTLRDERYDVSITATKEHAKLPVWTTVMSENAEITDLLLTPELISAVEQAGDLFDYLIITDQPINRPTNLTETVPKKRIYLSMRLPASDEGYKTTTPLFSYFLSLSDKLVEKAHFRPEVARKVKATREEMVKKLQKVEDDEKAEERALERDKLKKQKRDAELKGLDAKSQKKYLEKEKDRELKKSMKRGTMKA
jgi:hypothetical protein